MTSKALEELEVLCKGERVGTLRRRRGQLFFIYLDSWRLRDDATPLSLSMPLASHEHRHRVVEPFLWGLLPDNHAVLARWGRDFGVSTSHPVGLLANVGEDLPGAMQLVRPETLVEHQGSGKAGKVTWLETADVAAMLQTVSRDHTAWLTNQEDGGWSLAGAQPKLALLRDGDRWGRPTGRIPTTHILKPAMAGFEDHDLNEHLCLRAAAKLGLRAARTEVVVFDDQRAIVVERYDRLKHDGSWRRIHQEDMCQALGLHPSRKYQCDGGPSPAVIAHLLRANMPHTDAKRAVDAFIDALAFNWLIAAPDAHAKNYALLLSGPQVRIAPLFDIASALAYPNLHQPKLKLAMKIGGYYLVSAIGRSAWARLAEDLRVDPGSLVERVASLSSRVTDAFSDAAQDPNVAGLRSPLPGRLVDAVATRVASLRL